jgi:hypothetical protein
MTIHQFLRIYNVRPADAIVVKKENFGILDHYVIYLGHGDKGEPIFIANYLTGVQFLSADDLVHFVKTYVPVRINRFVGNDSLRRSAVKRALSKQNEQAYDLILNNCEHFATWVQKGIPKSNQVETFGQFLTIAGGVIGISGVIKRDDGMAVIGLLLASLGLITIGFSVQKDILPPPETVGD